MKLKKATIHKYKCLETEQSFDIDEHITVLVGMNESGKTSILEALAKSNYFQKDDKFTYDSTHDYPRKEKKTMDRSGTIPDVLTCFYSIPESLKEKINLDVGEDVFTQDEVSVSNKFSNKRSWVNVRCNKQKFIENITRNLRRGSKAIGEKLAAIQNAEELDKLIAGSTDETDNKVLLSLTKYFENKWNWQSDPINEYIARTYLQSCLPKFLYYDEYYALPSRISINSLRDDELEQDELKTAKALFDLADINIDELLNAENFEDFKAELEATEAIITDELFKYWTTNKNLEIEFDIDKKEKTSNKSVIVPSTGQQAIVPDVRIVDHILDIRVKNKRSRVSLPLKNRSKGFNWFFSFLVWFKKIQEDKNSNYILLLDEPGLNLHAAAQADLLRFLKDLSADYQIIYTTHSPFMIDSAELHTVRTVVETESG